jgi:hypothetical protein
MTDAQIIIRLKNMATDAHLSGDDIKGKVLGEAAARLTELSIIHHTWHPSIQEVANTPNEDYENLAVLVRKLLQHEPRISKWGSGYEITMRLDGIYYGQNEALEIYPYFADVVREIKSLLGLEVK